MKKTIRGITLVLSLLVLIACGKTSYHEQLQENKWQVVSSNGQSYTANFASDTVSFDTSIFSQGFAYEISEENIIELNNEDSIRVFEISEKGENELFLKAENDETYEATGNLTLMPLEKNTE